MEVGISNMRTKYKNKEVEANLKVESIIIISYFV